MAAKSSITDIDAQIEKLRQRKRMLIVKSAERFARAATKAGLAEMEIADEEVDHIIEEIAARFRKDGRKGASGETAPSRRPATAPVGATAETAHDG